MDITPLIPADRQVIQAYGDGGFRIAGTRWEGSVLVFPTRTLAWPVVGLDALSADSLEAVLETGSPPELLLVGCGPRMLPLPGPVRALLRGRGIIVDSMDTGAACRTYNVLMSEERRVAAALIAV